MDRIEAYELYESENESKATLTPLYLAPEFDLRRFQHKTKGWTPSNKEQALSDEIYQYFNKQLPFRRILINFIRNKGYEATYRNFKACKEGKTPIALFQWMMKQETVIWNHAPQI